MNEQLKTNLKRLPTNLTTYVVAVITGLAAWWLQLPPQEQANYLALYPWLKNVAPLAAVVSFVVAKVIPQYQAKDAAEAEARADAIVAKRDAGDTVPMDKP